MCKEYKLGVIGAGFMSTAIIKGVINSGVLLPKNIIVSDPNQIALDNISKLGVSVSKDNASVVNGAEYVLFAVKPQSLNDVLLGIKDCCCDRFISIMAGVKKEKIKKVFPNALVARCMPNTPCAIGCGAVGLDLSDFTDEEEKMFVKSLLSAISEVVCVDEDKLNAVTGVSGSAPAYFYLFLKGIIDAGQEYGLTYEQSKSLATATMIGAGKMVELNSDKSIDELINAVCSKGGTTIEAINVFNSGNLNDLTKKAIDACIKRSEELEKL